MGTGAGERTPRQPDPGRAHGPRGARPQLDEGPCRDAIWDERVVHSPDLLDDDRWPRWGRRAAEDLGVRSMLCFRLFTHDDTVGGLNLYARRPRAFDARDVEEGEALVAHVAVAVASAQRIEQLTQAVDSRTTTGQVVGILMERFDLDADRAFSVLARVSSHSNRKLAEVAGELVRTRRLPAADAG